MTSTASPLSATQDVVVRMLIAAEPMTVWSFFSDAARFASWIGAYGGGPPLPGTSIEPRIGGAVRVCYPPDGAAACGKITEWVAQRRIAFSWGYEKPDEGVGPGETRVEISLTPVEEGTLVELRHSGLPTEEARRGHTGGWTHYLSMLSRNAAGAQQQERLPATLDAYFRAWGAADEAARRRLLEQCCEPQVHVRTSFACTNDIAELSAHIAGALVHMPGMTLAPDGAPQTLHGYAVSRWVVRAPDGNIVFRGQNFMALSLRGKLVTLVSFAEMS